jgi:hypothetical protein
MADFAIQAFCAQQREWLDLELKSEQDQLTFVGESGSGGKQEEGTRAHVLHQLEAADVSIGLYGRTVVRLIAAVEAPPLLQQPQHLLPAHKFTTGDEVEIRSKSGGRQHHPAGVISEVTESSLSVALFPSKRGGGKRDDKNAGEDDDDNDDFSNPPFSLIPRSNVEVHRKLLAALTELETKGVDHPVASRIVQALFDPTTTTMNASTTTPTTSTSIPNDSSAPTHQQQPFNTNLDASQLEAISFSLTSNLPITLIHGPVRLVCLRILAPRLYYRYFPVLTRALLFPLCSPARARRRQSWNSFNKRFMSTDTRSS